MHEQDIITAIGAGKLDHSISEIWQALADREAEKWKAQYDPNIIGRLDSLSIQQVIKEVDLKFLALAMKGLDDNSQERVYENMSQRAATMLKEDIAYMGPQRHKSVREAGEKLVQLINNLHEQGRIVIPSQDPHNNLVG